MIERLVNRFLLIWLMLLSIVALSWPTDSPVGNPFAASKPYLTQLFMVTMFAVGSLMARDEIAEVFRRWPSVFSGTAVQYTVMPLLAYVAARIFPLEEDLLLGLIIVGCVPGAMASNVLTLMARGNVSYSVSLTSAATMLSPVVVPFVLFLATGHTGIDRGELARKAAVELCTMVIGPVVAGHLLVRWIGPLEKFLRTYGALIANLSILWLIATILHVSRSKIFPSNGPFPTAMMGTLIGALILVNILGYAGGYFGGVLLGLSESKRRALTIEVGMQNAGLGSVLALQLFPGHPMVGLPSVLYMFGCMLSGTVLAQVWSRIPISSAEPSESQPAAPPS